MKKKILIASLSVILIFANFFAGIAGAFIGVRYFIPSNNSVTKQVEVVTNNDAIADVVERVNSAVVSVIITKDLPVYEEYSYNPFGNDPFFNFGFPQRKQVGEEEREVGAGSGFIVSSDGYIVTNKHVVDDEEASYTVVLSTDERIDAQVVDRDKFLDIAVLKIDKNDLPYIEFGDSANLRVGEQVLAIGNTLGEFSNTVSSGIISGLYRSIVAGSPTGESEALSDLIQTDAAISQGNSGGPLVNIKGEAIGVNVAVSQQGENIGFAIPINAVKNIVKSIQENGKIIRPYLGIRYVQITSVMQEKNNLDYDYGALIVKGESSDDLAVIPGSPADKAGVVENDIILEINGIKLDSKTSLQNEVQKYSIGDEVTLKISSKGEEKEVRVKLEAMD